MPSGRIHSAFLKRTRRFCGLALVVLLLASTARAGTTDAPPPTDKELAQWTAELASDEFRVRQRAFDALEAAGEHAVPYVVEAVQSLDAEVRWRGEAILQRWLASRHLSAAHGARRLLEERIRTGDTSENYRAAVALVRLRDAWTTHAIEEIQSLGGLVLQQAGGAVVVRRTADGVVMGPGYQVQIQRSWRGGNDRLELLTEVGSVRWLSLEHAPINDRGLAHVGKLAELRNLYLGGSQITGEGLSQLGGLQQLQYLSLKQLPIDDDDLARLPDLPELKALGLDSTRVSDEGLAQLARFPSLEILWLDHSQITDAGVPRLAELKNLKTLYLQGMTSPGKGIAALKGLPDLKYLSLKGATLDDDSLKYVGQLDQLETLGLDHTNVTDDQLEQLAGMAKLKILWLSKTKVTDQAIAHLKQLPALETLYLHGSEITHDGANRLRESRPRIQVFR